MSIYLINILCPIYRHLGVPPICGKWMIWGYPYFRKPTFIAVHIMRFSYLAMYLSIPVRLVKFHTYAPYSCVPSKLKR